MVGNLTRIHMQEVILHNDCPAVRIPAGDRVTLPAGARLTIAQSLGGSVTVRDQGGLYRIAGEDLDALGAETAATLRQAPPENAIDGEFSEELLWEQLRQCFDPEIPLNIVDLGLIYDLRTEAVETGQYDVHVTMTLTAPGCGMGPVLVGDVEYRVRLVPNVEQVNVDLVFDPPWSRDMMSEEAQLETGMFF